MKQPARYAVAILIAVVSVFVFTSKMRSKSAVSDAFGVPVPVTVRGYSGVEMEPFITRDGQYLFFNNSNDPKTNTDLFWAKRIDKTTFDFQGEIKGVNTPALEGVASMDQHGRFYFISPRSYGKTLSTVYVGDFADGTVTGIALADGVSVKKPGIVDFDAEISGDGNTLYFAEGQFLFGNLSHSEIVVAQRVGSKFVRVANTADILQTVNEGRLDYAPSISTDGLDLYFTRAMTFPQMVPAIYVAHRRSLMSAFGSPERIGSIDGFAEGPSVTADGATVYYHKKVGAGYQIFCVSKR